MKAGRDPWFDNARWLAGSLVVVSHSTEAYLYSGSFSGWVYWSLWPMRLPVFTILVGYFTAAVPKPRDYSNLLRMVIAPFAVITALHLLLNYVWSGSPSFNILSPEYTLWFLVGVIVWRLTGPLLMRLRHPLLVAVLIALVTGAFEGLSAFRLHAVLSMLPFFVLGMLLRRDDSWLRRRTARSAAVAAGAVAAWVGTMTVLYSLNLLHVVPVSRTKDYEDGIAGNLIGMGSWLAVWIGAGLTALAVLHLMPRGRIRWISYIGAGGFTIYLLHGLVLRILRWMNLLPTPDDGTWWGYPFLFVFGFVLAAILGSAPVRWLARPLVRPKLDWLLLPSEPKPKPEGRDDAPRS